MMHGMTRDKENAREEANRRQVGLGPFAGVGVG